MHFDECGKIHIVFVAAGLAKRETFMRVRPRNCVEADPVDVRGSFLTEAFKAEKNLLSIYFQLFNLL